MAEWTREERLAPVPLYYELRTRLLDVAGELRDFLEGNQSRLKRKDPA